MPAGLQLNRKVKIKEVMDILTLVDFLMVIDIEHLGLLLLSSQYLSMYEVKHKHLCLSVLTLCISLFILISYFYSTVFIRIYGCNVMHCFPQWDPLLWCTIPTLKLIIRVSIWEWVIMLMVCHNNHLYLDIILTEWDCGHITAFVSNPRFYVVC
jgi:hypothetical protein